MTPVCNKVVLKRVASCKHSKKSALELIRLAPREVYGNLLQTNISINSNVTNFVALSTSNFTRAHRPSLCD